MTEPDRRTRSILVLDSAAPAERPLAETVSAAGHAPVSLEDVDGLVAAYLGGESLVALVAFEALWPTPQVTVRTLRKRAPGLRLVVMYRSDSPRLQLGNRMWTVNLIDYWLPRHTPPPELLPVLRQAYTDALIERASGAKADPSSEDLQQLQMFEFIHEVGQALNNERRLEGLLRLLHRKLPRAVDHQLMQILVARNGANRLFSFPTVRQDYDLTWKLAEAVCRAVQPLVAGELSVDTLEMFQHHPLMAPEQDSREAGFDEHGHVELPMMVQGELVGCLAVLFDAGTPLRPDQQMALRLISDQLGASISNVLVLEDAEDSSHYDELTGLHNARYLEEVLPTEWRRVRRYNLQFSVAIFDVDRLREINQRYGYLVGDAALIGFGAILGRHLRETDQVIRYGGKKFLLLLPETGPAEAAIVIERIRASLNSQPVFSSDELGPIQVACTVGVSSFPTCPVNLPEDLISLAEQALLSAKLSGGDQVCMAAGKTFSSLESDGTAQAGEKRRFPRIEAELCVRYMELPDFEGQLTNATTINVNAGGIAIEDSDRRLKKHVYALVYVEDTQVPVLSRVVWTKDDSGSRTAGLRFLRAGDIGELVEKTQKLKAPPEALVITDDPKTWNLIQRTLIAARYRMRVLRKEQDLEAGEQLSSYAVVVVGESSLRAWFGRRLMELRSEHGTPGRVVVINETGDHREALSTVCSHQVEHMVSADEMTDESLFATLNKLLLGEYFGIQKYLLWGVNPASWSIQTAGDKEHVLHGVRQIAREVYCHPRIADLMIAAVDEMLINAMYHGGSLDSAQPVTVECGTDGRLLAVSVIDERGVLKHEDIYRGLGNALLREQEGIPDDVQKANLGFRVMLNCLSQLAVNVEPGRRTEIIGIVDLRKSVLEYRKAIPSLGLFTTEDDTDQA